MYWFAFLGLLPGIGGLAGLFFIIAGVFKFKDLKLILLGIADILFTLLIWGALRIGAESGNFFADSDKMIVRNELNAAVKAIEFHKLQTTSYPDSLPQLMEDDSLFAIYDLFTKETRPPASYFTYYKIGNKYTIFSVGPDGKPNTADDMYPTVEITDSTKIGLIRK